MAWRDLETDHDDERSLREIAADMGVPFRDVTLTIGEERVPLKDFSFAFACSKPAEDELLTAYTTTNVTVTGTVTMTPEEEDKLAQWWAERWGRELMRQICGEPSEYEHSLRAAGAKV